MIGVNKLRSLDPEAWTALVKEDARLRDVVVTAVEEEVISHRSRGASMTRYLLTLANHPEEVSLIGRATNKTEGLFYRNIARHLPTLVPHCWFSHLGDDESWLIVDEVYNDHQPENWGVDDVEGALKALTLLHGKFWDRDSYLATLGLPTLLSPLREGADKRPTAKFKGERWSAKAASDRGESHVSKHALQSAGPLAPRFLAADKGLTILQKAGGWPGVFTEPHILAAMDLLDDPVPILQPLRELPVTLLHGHLALHNWYTDMFGQRRLVNWRRAVVGPGIWDLVTFLDQINLLRRTNEAWCQEERRLVSEETLVDSYILAMGEQLTSGFDAWDIRSRLPAAHCLQTLLTWLPRFASWFQTFPAEAESWEEFNRLSDWELEEAGFSQMVKLRTYLTAAFEEFLDAYRML